MLFTLKRRFLQKDKTISYLLADGNYLGIVLEDVNRDANADGDLSDEGEAKVYGQTAIPFGRYEIKRTYSPKFKKILPELLNVPGFTGIRVHPGNTIEHTLGCLLPGTYYSDGKVVESTAVFLKFDGLLQAAEEAGERSYIDIIP